MDTKLIDRFNKINSGTAPRKFVKDTIIRRYPQTNAKFYKNKFADPKISALHQAFMYQRGVPVFLKDGSTEMKFASNMMTGPSVAVQVLEKVKIDSESTIFEPFCGAGYFSLFLSILRPKQLICSDKFTPEVYDLQKTFENGLKYIFESKVPAHTKPIWLQLDATKDSPGENFRFNRVFLHPPFSFAMSKFSPEITEDQAISIWLSSIGNSKRLLRDSSSLIISIVPDHWTETLSKHFPRTINKVIPLEEIEQFPTNIIVTQFRD